MKACKHATSGPSPQGQERIECVLEEAHDGWHKAPGMTWSTEAGEAGLKELHRLAQRGCAAPGVAS